MLCTVISITMTLDMQRFLILIAAVEDLEIENAPSKNSTVAVTSTSAGEGQQLSAAGNELIDTK